MKINHYTVLPVYILLYVLCLLQSCQKSEIPYYNNAFDAIRFPKRDASDKRNTEPPGYDFDTKLFKASYSFVTTPDAPSYDYEIPLQLIGMVADRDREVSYTIDKTQTHAPADSYQIIKAVVPAGSRSGKLIVRIFNTENLKKESNTLFIKLASSKDLHSGPESLIQGTLTWSIRIPAPAYSALYQTYNSLIESPAEFNSSSKEYFSLNALETIVKAMEWYDLDDLEKYPQIGNGVRYGKYKYLPSYVYIVDEHRYEAYALILAEYIEKYNKKNPKAPLLHDSGKSKGQPIVARQYQN